MSDESSARSKGAAPSDDSGRHTVGIAMGDGLAASNVNRSYSLAGTCVAIFSFTLIFLYPRFANGEVNGILLQATLLVLGLATFSLLFASVLYYYSSVGGAVDDSERSRYSRRGDLFWLLGCALLFLDPSLVLASVQLVPVGFAWFVLWLVYMLILGRFFPRVQAGRSASN